MNHTLESYKIFPYVAWALVVGFALFTYMLAIKLEENIASYDTDIAVIETRLDALEARVGTTPSPATR